MIKKFFSIIIVLMLLLSIVYKANEMMIDSKYAIEVSKVFQTYDIGVIDDLLSPGTELICGDKKTTYEHSRKNIVLACKEKEYIFTDSYGHGNDAFTGGIQSVEVYVYGKFNGKKLDECTCKIQLRKTGLFSYQIDSIESSEPVFEYLFFGR